MKKQRLVPFTSGHGNKTDTGAVLILREKDRLARFEQTILPHLDAAYNLARWLTRDEHDAEDMVQEAYLRAFKFFNAFRGVDGRAWLLTIVRNTCYTWLQQNRAHEITTMFDEYTVLIALLQIQRLLRCRALTNKSSERLWMNYRSSFVKWWSYATWRASLIKKSLTSSTFQRAL